MEFLSKTKLPFILCKSRKKRGNYTPSAWNIITTAICFVAVLITVIYGRKRRKRRTGAQKNLTPFAYTYLGKQFLVLADSIKFK